VSEGAGRERDSALAYRERAAGGAADGLLVLHHGRGTDELDLLRLADELDPARRLQLVSPRAPLSLEGSPGFHWYLVPRPGFPDLQTFNEARELLARFHDELWERTGIGPARTVLGGFSMGSVMSYALGLDAARPAPAGILAFSGFLPTQTGWQPDLAERAGLPVFIAHGETDPIIDVRWAREAERTLRDGGLSVEYHESPGLGHQIDGKQLASARSWLAARLAASP